MPYPFKNRMFLVGNGASLNDTPLHLLNGEDSFGMNRIHLLYNKTPWRPTHYFCIDVADGDTRYKEYVLRNQQAKLFLWDAWKNQDLPGDITWITRCAKHHFYASDNFDKRVQSWHLPEICTAISSMSVMMQLAVLMGKEVIYLLGCDLWDGKVNHFSNDYVADEDVERRNRDTLYMHEVAKQSCPIPIVNCTVGGRVDTYPRERLEDVIAR